MAETTFSGTITKVSAASTGESLVTLHSEIPPPEGFDKTFKLLHTNQVVIAAANVGKPGTATYDDQAPGIPPAVSFRAP